MADGMKWPHIAASIILLMVAITIFVKCTSETVRVERSYEQASEPLEKPTKTKPEKRVEKVTEGVYVAQGFAFGNSILLIGPKGVVIVDTSVSFAVAAKEIVPAFQNITKAPVQAIVYTHHHVDHIQGAQAFVDWKNSNPEIWAHEEFLKQLQKNKPLNPLTLRRAMRQFGVNSDDNGGLDFTKSDGSLGYVKPTHIVKGKKANATLAGLEVQLLHIPSESDDHLGIWIPSKRVFICGDVIYNEFPNLGTFSGSRARDPIAWVGSLDIVRHLRPQYLVSGHAPPQYGEDHIFSLLTDYRDAIQFVTDQTMRYINKGLFPVDIVQNIKLPVQLATHDFLQEGYGTVRWSVKGIFSYYLGWFSGNIIDLEPLNTREKARRMIQLAGGIDSLAAAAQSALSEADPRWALELSSHIFYLNPNHEQARKIRLDALNALAAEQTSVNGKNYYLSTALEDQGIIDIKVPKSLKTYSIYKSSMEELFRVMAVRLTAEKVEGQEMVLVFNFTDIGEVFTIALRNSILDIQANPALNWDVKVTMVSMLWRKLLNKEVTPLSAYLGGDLVIEGKLSILKSFMSYIEQE